MSDSALVRIICTDRGQHPSRQLDVFNPATAMMYRDLPPDLVPPMMRTPMGADAPNRRGERHGTRVSVGDGTPAPKRQWVCPTCGRDVQLKPEKLELLITGAAERGARKIDVSYIPGSLST